MQNSNSKRNILLLIILVIIVIISYFAFRGQTDPLMQSTDISYTNPCPYTLAEDDMFKIVLEDCEPNIPLAGTPQPLEITGGLARTVNIQTIDGSQSYVFRDMQVFVDPNEASTISAAISHDSTNSYVFLDRGTSVIRSLEVFSLKDQRYIVLPYIEGVVTQNGYLVYTSADGLPNVHGFKEQPNATDVIALKLSDFSKTKVFSGDSTNDFGLDGEYFKNGIVVPTIKEDFISVVKLIWNGYNVEKQEKIQFLISKLNNPNSTASTNLPQYISAQEGWPPVIKTSAKSYSCVPQHSQAGNGFDTSEKVINGKAYCVYSTHEGAAGSTYSTYTYTSANGSGTKTTTFTFRRANCGTVVGNPGEAQYEQCQSNQKSFFDNLDSLIASLM